jgi:hypothetical protein
VARKYEEMYRQFWAGLLLANLRDKIEEFALDKKT